MMSTDEFWNFLGSWFPDADIEGIDDDAMVVQNFMRTGNHAKVDAVKRGLCEVLELKPLPMERISDEANRYFESETVCRDWLRMCLRVLENAPE